MLPASIPLFVYTQKSLGRPSEPQQLLILILLIICNIIWWNISKFTVRGIGRRYRCKNWWEIIWGKLICKWMKNETQSSNFMLPTVLSVSLRLWWFATREDIMNRSAINQLNFLHLRGERDLHFSRTKAEAFSNYRQVSERVRIAEWLEDKDVVQKSVVQISLIAVGFVSWLLRQRLLLSLRTQYVATILWMSW